MDCLELVNGKECVTYLENLYRSKKCSCEDIQVIFMDVEMPVMDGIEATIEIKRMEKEKILPYIPIVGLTAYLDTK